MTNEEFEKTKEFIIQQQAQFAVDIEKLKETTKVIAEATLANTAMIGKVIGIMDSLAQSQKRTDEKLAESQKRTDEKLAETSERLNFLINVVERHINEGHNGKSKG